MISVAEARALILERAPRLASEEVALADASGRTLADAIVATRAQPPFAASAMDGYALRSADTPGTLRIVGEAIAGRALGRALGPGEAARIFTGAPVPEGADAILIQEDAKRDGDALIAPRVPSGLHVRAAGIDFAAGQELLPAGHRLDGPALALAAASGAPRVRVVRAPRIAIFSGGAEIVPPGAEPRADQIHDSVSYGLAGLARDWGARAQTHAPLPDDREAIAAAIGGALGENDLVVMVGGASVGEHDHARAAAAALGATLSFEKVAVRPGKPTWFATRGEHPILGLPGNPASALVCARLFLKPLLESMLGRDPADAGATHAARLKGALAPNGPRETYLRAHTSIDSEGRIWAEAASAQDSSLMSVIAASNALILRTPHAPAAKPEDSVQVLPL